MEGVTIFHLEFRMDAGITAWALAQFGSADISDPRLKRRLTGVAGKIAAMPGGSLPKQTGNWGDLKAAYRLFSNERITADGIQQGHRDLTRVQCAKSPVILCVQDTSSLDFTRQKAMKGRGKIASGESLSRGIQQHSGMAVSCGGAIMGLLHQRWYRRPEAPENETKPERDKRWTEGRVWLDMAKSVSKIPGCRVVHVGDRGSDITDFFHTCATLGAGFVVRATHDRLVEKEGANTESQETAHLWETLEKQEEVGRIEVDLAPQNSVAAQKRRTARRATLSIRHAEVRLKPIKKEGMTLWAILLREEAASTAITEGKPVEWMLLTSEPVTDLESAMRIIKWYTFRWRIEEFHRALKEGCKLEASQMDDVEDIKRLAAVLCVVAIRLLQLRDMARDSNPQTNTPEALRSWAPESWIRVVAMMEKTPVAEMTPRSFLLAIARKGGFIGRKGDGNPGWKTIWQGWIILRQIVFGAELVLEHQTCG